MKFANSKMFFLLALTSLVLVFVVFISVQGKQLPEKEVVRIAHTYVKQRYNWAESAQFEIKQADGFWEVAVTSPDLVPTSKIILYVEIDDGGQITGFM